jgi:hypothetical protein
MVEGSFPADGMDPAHQAANGFEGVQIFDFRGTTADAR